MSDKHKRKRDYKRKHPAFVHQPVNSPADKRKVNKSVKPHRVHKLNRHISHKRIAQRENYQRSIFRLSGFSQKERKSYRRRTYFGELHKLDSSAHSRSRQQTDYKHERTCEIIRKYTEHFSRKIP